MTLVKKPVNGMKDILPAEQEIRDYVLKVIKDTYAAYGFTPMETPVVESLTNLLSKQGGDNEKLIFKILKRGEKLKIAEAKEENDLADAGLRYDLTVPLVRYYANHKEELPTPFKALQTGPVFRADRPQKGRFRQFVQCDIDILGEPGCLAEIELISATGEALTAIGFKDFVVRINDRRLLKAMATFAGMEEMHFDEIFVTLDKMDKIGENGVAKELQEIGCAPEAVKKYLALFQKVEGMEAVSAIRSLQTLLGDCLEADVADSLCQIIESVKESTSDDFSLAFDPTLVRGMGYYTGTIFEVMMAEFGSSCGGGGRYDKMVGKFTGQEVSACGFSIGFERIVMLLMEKGFTPPAAKDKCCFLIEKGIEGERLTAILKEAAALRKDGTRVLTVRMNKNKKFQKEQLAAAGYTSFQEFYKEALKR